MIAVVAVPPLAIGVRYSVCDLCVASPGKGAGEDRFAGGIHCPCWAFAWASCASFEVGRDLTPTEGDAATTGIVTGATSGGDGVRAWAGDPIPDDFLEIRTERAGDRVVD